MIFNPAANGCDGAQPSFSLIKRDGSILARHPAPPGDLSRFGPNSGFMRTVSANPEKKPAVVATAVYPAGDRDRLAEQLLVNLSAVM